MILKGNEDLRIKKTITNIHNSFINLILKKDYSKITVKEVCNLAVINKKTFYNYYKSLDELLFEMQEIMLIEYTEKIKNLKVPEDLYKINEEFFRYSVSKGEVYEKIMCSENYAFLGKNVAQNFVKYVWKSYIEKDKIDKSRQNILFCYLQNVGLELYRQWVYDKKQIPLDEIIKLSGELLCSGVNGFINRK